MWPSPQKSGVAPKTKAVWKQSGNQYSEKDSGLQNFCNYANMTRNLLKPYEGSSRREKCFGPNLVV